MTITKSLIYFAFAGSLLYFAFSKPKNTASIPVSAPVVRLPSVSDLFDQAEAAQINDPNYVPADPRDIHAGYVPIDHNRLNWAG